MITTKTTIQPVSHYLSIAVFQFAPQWLNRRLNLTTINQQIDALEEKPDLFVLPEMFSTGFSMDAIENYTLMDGEDILLLKSMSKEHNVAICGSLIIRDKGAFYNRFIFISPNGNVETYDKKHLFTMGDEHSHYTPGTMRCIIDYKGWKIMPTICYDIRFPVWCRNNMNYDILLCVANWPMVREETWNTLLKARAIENQCYVIAVNRTGTDGNNIQYNGQSVILDAKGQEKMKAGNETEVLETILDKYKLQEYRKTFPVLKDSDSFQIY